MAEELEEHENARSRSISTPRRHRGKSQSEDGRVRLQELNQELAEIKTAEEDGIAASSEKGCFYLRFCLPLPLPEKPLS